MRTDVAPTAVRREDYRPPAYRIDTVDLDFRLDPQRTVVKSRLAVRCVGPAGAPLILNGEALELLSIALDGRPLAAGAYDVDGETLTIAAPPAAFTLEIETAFAPEANTALSGLYISNGMFCTQCEAEGFRRITYYLDRPDILAKFTVRIEADKTRYPVLLANGNRIDGGDVDAARHFAVWRDPFPKPSYLFALVAGELAAVEDTFVTRSGRAVKLAVFVQPQNRDKCGYALDSLKRAMRWDEDAFGREYDLDIFMIVAVDHFNFGAMENKGLNIFNSAYVLASPETATDADYEAIESIVAHEYFHNWSGNRVTCRDWFQLCLKEGFTVFRDQEFSADMRSRPVQRIKDVRALWSRQFPEDAGPLAHPVRPESYITIDNFYTATVYEKGAELCRMIKTKLGPEKFRAGSDLYFDRHDGEAATVEDFVKAMEDASGVDLRQFRLWYSDAGTPEIGVSFAQSPDGARLTLSQATKPTPGQSDKPARDIPVALAFIGAQSGRVLAESVVALDAAKKSFEVGAFAERAIPSILRGYSAPATVAQDLTLEDRLVLLRAEPDLFSRWAIGDRLWKDLCFAFADIGEAAGREATLDRFAGALGESLRSAAADPAFAAELLRAPSEADIAQEAPLIDPDKIVEARRRVRATIGAALAGPLADIHRAMRSNQPYDPAAPAAGRRALKNAAMGLLLAAGDDAFAREQAASAANLTDEAAAVSALAVSTSPHREEALARFYEKWRGDSLVVNKWLGWRALLPHADALSDIDSLIAHPAYDARNPNKVRALLGVFALQNLKGFHRADGGAYERFVDWLLEIDSINPQLAARLTTAFELWKKLEPARRTKAGAALARLGAAKGVSANLFEMATRLVAE